jgi:hypothetical protein
MAAVFWALLRIYCHVPSWANQLTVTCCTLAWGEVSFEWYATLFPWCLSVSCVHLLSLRHLSTNKNGVKRLRASVPQTSSNSLHITHYFHNFSDKQNATRATSWSPCSATINGHQNCSNVVSTRPMRSCDIKRPNAITVRTGTSGWWGCSTCLRQRAPEAHFSWNCLIWPWTEHRYRQRLPSAAHALASHLCAELASRVSIEWWVGGWVGGTQEREGVQ